MSDEATQTAADQAETLDEALGEGSIGDEIEAELAGNPPADEPAGPDGAMAEPLSYEQLAGGQLADAESVRDLDLIADVDVEVAVEFGRVDIPIRQILQIRRGSLVELHRRPEAQVTVLANGKPIALGDIVVVDGQVGVHIVELIDPESATAPIAPPAQVTLEERVVEVPEEGDADESDESIAESD